MVVDSLLTRGRVVADIDLFSLVTWEWPEVVPGEVQTANQEQVLYPGGGWALEQAPQGSDHSTKADRAQGVFGQNSQAQGGILGLFSLGPGVGFQSSLWVPCNLGHFMIL